VANEEDVALLKRGIVDWNAWRARSPTTSIQLANAILTNLKLSDANLFEALLFGADLSAADLAGANLSCAHLEGACLLGANLTGANLTNAQLSDANLTGADLTYADLTHANLNQTNLTMAKLTGTNLTTTVLCETVFAAVNLTQSVGLESCNHLAPSILDHRTLLNSKQLPLVFLRGVGLPDRLIEYLPSLMDAGPIQFYSCFISYSTQNQDFADRLHADLQANGGRCWFAPHDMQPGKKMHEQIDEAIRLYDRLLLILSNESMESRWVKTEIAKARQKEIAQKRNVLFPLTLVPFEDVRRWEQFDADLGEDIAKEIREFHLSDFSHWKTHDAYRRAFERLLNALKTVE